MKYTYIILLYIIVGGNEELWTSRKQIYAELSHKRKMMISYNKRQNEIAI